MKVKNRINWKLFFLLLTASALSIVAIMPYIITLQGDLLRATQIPLPLMIVISVIQSIVFFAIFLFIGLRLSQKLWLQIPILEKLVARKKIGNIRPIIKTSVLLWCVAGIIIIWLDFLFSKSGINLTSQIHVPLRQGFLASFYGGISEEIVMRLFFMTIILRIINKFYKGKIIKNKIAVWLAIIIASVIFGLGHLPITWSLTTITPVVVIRAILLNGVGGVIFGWLYRKKGLESAIIAHFSADIMIQIALPLVLMFL